MMISLKGQEERDRVAACGMRPWNERRLGETRGDVCIIMARAVDVVTARRALRGANRWIPRFIALTRRDRAVFSTGFSTESVNIVQHQRGRDTP